MIIFDGCKACFELTAERFVIKNLQIDKDAVLTFHLCTTLFVNFPNSCFQDRDQLDFEADLPLSIVLYLKLS